MKASLFKHFGLLPRKFVAMGLVAALVTLGLLAGLYAGATRAQADSTITLISGNGPIGTSTCSLK